MSRFGVETAGSWRAIADGEAGLYKKSQWTALRDEGEAVKKAARESVAKNAGKAKLKKLASTIRGQVFPKKPGGRAPAYALGRKRSVLDHFETGGVATARRGALPVPIGEAKKVAHPAFAPAAQRAARAMAAMRAKYGSGLVIRRVRGKALFGVWTDPAKFKALFVFRRSVRVPKLVNVTGAIAGAGAGLGERVGRRAMQLFEAGHAAVIAKATGQK